MKDCKKIHPLLSLYAEGDLPAAESKRVETHLASCADARKELEHLRRLRKTLLGLPEPIPPASLHDSIMGRVTGKVRPLRPHRPFFNFPIAGLAVAACLVLYLVVANPELLKMEHPAPVSQAPVTSIQKNASTLANNAPVPTQKDKGILRKVKKEAPATSNYAPQPATSGAVAKQEIHPSEVLANSEKRPRAKKAVSRPQASQGYEAGAPAAQSSVQSLGSNPMNDQELKAAAPRAQLALAPPTPVPTEGWMADIAFSKKFTASAWSGDNSPATVEGGQLITDQIQFENIWKTLRPTESVPVVDFTTQAVVLLYDGGKPSPGYKLDLSQMEDKGTVLILHYHVVPPTGPVFTIGANPWTLQVIPKPSLPVQFQKD